MRITTLCNSMLSIALTSLVTVSQARADVTIGAPSPLTANSCDDYFVNELNNPVDMSDNADVNNFFKDQDIKGITGLSMSNGVFSGTTVAGSTSLFYLWSPYVCGSYPVGGRFGAKTSLGYDHVINFTPALANKYNRLSVRMYHPAVVAGSGASVRVRYDRDCSYGNKLSVSAANGLKEGWHTYTFDLRQAPSAGDSTPWISGDVTGLAIEPTQQGNAQVRVDWVRLEDAASCASANISVSYSATTTNNNDLMRFYLDDDTNPLNGYVKAFTNLPQAASGNGTVTLSELTAVPPGSYYVTVVQDSDLATLWGGNPWDFGSNDDVSATGDISGVSYSGGALNGTTSTSDGNIFLKLPGNFAAASYSKLSIRVTGASIGDPSVPVRLLWNGGFKDLRTTDVEYQGNGLWHVDLSGTAGWAGTIDTFIVRPAIQAGRSFSLDFVSLRSSGFDTSRTTSTPQIFASNDRLRVNAPPVGQLTKPNFHSGETLRPWNMNTGDFVLLTNLQPGVDPNFPSENYCSYLPDVRKVDGLRGDFFKGANEAGNGDPNPHSVFPLFTDNPITFAASEYKNLCYKMLIDKEFSLRDGHHGRVLWENSTSYTSEDLTAIFDRWSGSRWYEYCMDMSKLPIDGQTTNPGWNGTVTKFRVDPHEWSHSFLNDDITVPPDAVPISVPFYYDYIKLRKAASAKRKHTLVYDVTDTDDASPTVSFFANTSRSTSGGTAIPEGNLSCSGRVCVWDSTHLANGSYWIYARVNDTRNSTAFLSAVPVVVDNSSSSTLSAPDLVLERPTDGMAVCNDLQLKGYAVQPDNGANVPVQIVQVLVDGRFLATIDPVEFSPAAKAAYSSSDASNTGFNRLLDVSGLTTGAHTVSVTAYGVHGATTVRSFAITKQTSSCPTPAIDADPAGAPIVAPVGPPPGAGVNISMNVTPSGNNLHYDVSGIDNKCTQVRLKITDTSSKLNTGPFTFIQTITDTSRLASGSLQYISEDVPRIVAVAGPQLPLCRTNKKYRTCSKRCAAIPRGLKGKQLQNARKRRAACLTRCERTSRCVTKQPSPTPSGDVTASIQADCGDGTGTSAAIEVDASAVGNSSRPVTSIDQWVDALRLSGKPR